jgi:glycosyltransferase involved in cell wall biosynthesis
MDHYRAGSPQEAEVFVSIVVPAYNEEKRLGGMLEEAVDYLQQHSWGTYEGSTTAGVMGGKEAQRTAKGRKQQNGTAGNLLSSAAAKGWEILIVSDGSTDKTIETALSFARSHQLFLHPTPIPGPRTPHPNHSTQIPPGAIRVISLEENRGKGGAVIHGMRHVRGEYVIFADADGASKFSDLGRLMEECRRVEDSQGRGVAVGSRAHLVGSEAVVKVQFQSSPAGESVKLKHLTLALFPTQLPNAFFPLSPTHTHAYCHCRYQRYPMWLQALFTPLLTSHHPVHAFRGLDLRCRDADARRVCGHPRHRGSSGVEGGRG